MRVLLQRVTQASVTVSGECVSAIGAGLLALLAVQRGDGEGQARRLAQRTLSARVFADGDRPMNRSVRDVGGAVLVVSQFTLAANTRRGNRPDFGPAAPPGVAAPLYECYLRALAEGGVAVKAGVFGADMQVALVNDGPVTILLEVEGDPPSA